MGAYLLMAQGVKKASPDWINDWDYIGKAMLIREFIPRQVGKTFMKLYEERKLARWVVDSVDVDAFEIASK